MARQDIARLDIARLDIARPDRLGTYRTIECSIRLNAA